MANIEIIEALKKFSKDTRSRLILLFKDSDKLDTLILELEKELSISEDVKTFPMCNI
jgi:hypothetical protein